MPSNGTNALNGNGNKRNALPQWTTDPRWTGITRPYSYSDVLRLRGSIQIEYTLARLGAERLWNLMHTDAYVPALGAITGNQAIEMVQAGLKAIYGSGWQVAADGNTAGDVYPDQSLYPCDSAPNLAKRTNPALMRADQIESAERKKSGTHWVASIARGQAYAPYADMLGCATATPDLAEAKTFAEDIHANFPGKLLALNCPPSFNWKKKLDGVTVANFRQEPVKVGSKFQFVTLA